MERLAAYEDLCFDAEGSEVVTINRLRELAMADQEERCMTLPCRVGDTVWAISAYGIAFDEPKSATVERFVLHNGETPFLEALLFMDIGKGWLEYGYSAGSFGRLFFATSEEAEAALAAGKEQK